MSGGYDQPDKDIMCEKSRWKFIANCGECKEEFEYNPWRLNSTMDTSSPYPVCPKCKKHDQTKVLRKELRSAPS